MSAALQPMPRAGNGPEIRFERARLWSPEGGEDARLGLADGQLVTVLAPAGRDGWYLETGFGPCAAEGLLFKSLAVAETWIRERFTLGAN